MRKRVTYRPSRGESVFSGVVGVIFVLIGLATLPVFGPFGLLWTLVAAGIAGMHLYRAFGSKYIGPEIQIEDEEPSGYSGKQPPTLDPKSRLEQLEALKTAGLISEGEYQQKRQEILRGL